MEAIIAQSGAMFSQLTSRPPCWNEGLKEPGTEVSSPECLGYFVPRIRSDTGSWARGLANSFSRFCPARIGADPNQ